MSEQTDQAYYWTPAWQAGEQESAEDRARGDVRVFATGAEAIAWLQEDADDPA